jgi:hypothetical protein
LETAPISSRNLLIGHAVEIVKRGYLARHAKGNGNPAEEYFRRTAMAKTVSMIGIDPGELAWVRNLLLLLRHPDPLIPEMTRQALVYLESNAHGEAPSRFDAINQAG